MLGQVGFRVSQASQVNNVFDARVLGGLTESPGSLDIQFVKAGASGHTVNQVVRGIDACQRFRQGFRVEGVADGHLNLAGPRTRKQTVPVADKNADATPFFNQPWG